MQVTTRALIPTADVVTFVFQSLGLLSAASALRRWFLLLTERLAQVRSVTSLTADLFFG